MPVDVRTGSLLDVRVHPDQTPRACRPDMTVGILTGHFVTVGILTGHRVCRCTERVSSCLTVDVVVTLGILTGHLVPLGVPTPSPTCLL